MLRPIAALLLLPLFLGACAAPMRVSLTDDQRAKIREVKAHVIIVQDEVIAAVQPSQVSLATGGGLVGALIDSSITNNRVKDSQKIMGPFYASIEDVDYRKEFDESIRKELANYPIKLSEVRTTPRMPSKAELDAMAESLPPGQALLAIVPRYFLTMDFRNLDSEALVTIWVKGSTAAPVQRGVLYYQSQPVGSGGKASMDLWAANNAGLFRSTLRDSIAELAKLILLDFKTGATPGNPKDSLPFAFNTGASQIQIKGHALAETSNRTVMLGDDGKLYSLPKADAAAVAQR